MSLLKSTKKLLREKIPGMRRLLPRKSERRSRSALKDLVDLGWYEKLVNSPSPFRRKSQCIRHFEAYGSAQCLALNPDMAGPDGKTLAPWATELLLRMSYQVGARGGSDLDPGDARADFAFSITPSKGCSIAVVSAIFGGIDRLLPAHDAWREVADFYLFTDRDFADAIGWRQIHANFFHENSRRRARFFKVHLPLYFSAYDWVIWLDGNVTFCVSPDRIVKMAEDRALEFASFYHPIRTNLFSEAAACARSGKDDARVLAKQLATYGDNEVARSIPLFETNVMVLRPNSLPVKHMMGRWWRELLNGSLRGQVSLGVALAGTPDLKWGQLAESNVRDGPYFVMTRHSLKSVDHAADPVAPKQRGPMSFPSLTGRSKPRPALRESQLSIEVIVCVHNSPDVVSQCLNSIAPLLNSRRRLIIVDDGSDEPTESICADMCDAHPDTTRLIRRPSGSGFCRAANNGLRESSADFVVVLNSDTIVVGDWMERLVACADLRPEIGVVGPLSNAASWQSIPAIWAPDGSLAVNDIPADPEVIHDIHVACADFGQRYEYPVTEVVNGFCLGVKRQVIDTIGLFDEERFPEGYGEENDFCFRALDAGFVCAVAIDTFVFHSKSKSYGDARRKTLSVAGEKALRERYGKERASGAGRSMRRDPVLTAIRAEAAVLFRQHGWMKDG